jgi:uncharacterized protein (DUF885 family)/Tol biopolymer transport system component
MLKFTAKLILVFVLLLVALAIAGCNGEQLLDQGASPESSRSMPPGDTGESEEPPTGYTEPEIIPEQVAFLAGLPIAEFFDQSFRFLMLRDPEWIVSEGLTEILDAHSDQLTDISDGYLRQTQDLQVAVLDLLHGYDRDKLSPEEQVSYDVYEWYLEDLIRQAEFMYYDYPVAHFTIGVQNQLINFFTDIHPVENRQDAEDYISRLSQVDTKIDGLIEGLKLREQAGIVAPKFILQWSTGGIRNIAQSSPRRTPFYGAFEAKLIALEGMGDETKQALLDEAGEAIAASVIPAYQELETYLEHLKSVAPSDDGVWQFPNGEAYYAQVLRHFTTTDMTPEEIHDLGYKELERIHEEMRGVFKRIGYPVEGVGWPDLFDRVAEEGGYVSGSQAAQIYEQVISEAESKLDTAFDLQPEADLVVIGGSTGDYYVSGALDGSRPGAFYALVTGGQDYYGMPTLAYHEGVPGHHFQISIAQETDLPLFRNIIGFLGYTEGWALYAERLAWELGWYDDDPYGDLGRLQAEAFRAARLVIDTGIHVKGWTYDQALEFMVENVGFEPGDNVSPEFEISRYIAWPGQAAAYKIGMLKILELRHRAMDQLGGNFDLRGFHNVILSNGSMPLDILERVVEDYIITKSASAVAVTNEMYADLADSQGVIAFTSYRGGEADIYTMDPDGRNILPLTRTTDRDSRPDWSADGSRIAYVYRVDNSYNYEIYTMDAQGSAYRRLTKNLDSLESEPAWSPDGSQIVFTSNRQTEENTFTGRFNVYVMNADGSDQYLLTDFGGSNSDPDWSPDGSRIAFQSTRDENFEVYLINPDGSGLVNLTEHPASDHSPAWSPDGSRIAFVSDRDGNEEIYIMAADGSNPTRLTYKWGYDKGPSWSPDGRFIVYYATYGINAEIYVMRADGSARIKLTNHGNFDGFPDWQP